MKPLNLTDPLDVEQWIKEIEALTDYYASFWRWFHEDPEKLALMEHLIRCGSQYIEHSGKRCPKDRMLPILQKAEKTVLRKSCHYRKKRHG